ncbi:MAG TPA: DoxX family protein [Rhizomicrobium sp.]|jgi:putative oxidoreductase|nr:DoxX family protein [Rhizomicrobium sp.]
MTTVAQRPVAIIESAIGLLNRVPYSALALVARMATFSVFFRSGLVKIADWNATLQLFQNEYKVPVLPPEIAATMSASMELGLSTLVLVGLFTRLSALGLLGMVLVIQTFVYPMAWPDHIQWLAFMLFIVCRGPGVVSLDYLLGRLVGVKIAQPQTV